MGQRRGIAAAVALQHHVLGEEPLQGVHVALLRRCEEPAGELVAFLLGGLEARLSLVDVSPCPDRELPRVVLALADDLRDLGVVVVEDVVEEQRGALLGRQVLEQNEEGEREGARHLGLASRVLATVGHDGLRQPLSDVGLTAGSGRAPLVGRKPSCDGGDEGAGRFDLLALVESVVDADQRLLHHVLGLRDAAEHPVGDREGSRTELLEELFVGLAHAVSGLRSPVAARPLSAAASSANPSRQLGCRGVQPSSRVSLAFAAPRNSVIMSTAGLPAKRRPRNFGTRFGFGAPIISATPGSHSATGSGLSSVTLYTPRSPPSIAATVASAASSMWMKDQTADPSPAIGNFPFTTGSRLAPSAQRLVPGP